MQTVHKLLCYIANIIFSEFEITTTQCIVTKIHAPPWRLKGEHVGFMTWWLRARSPVEANFLSSISSPLTSAEARERSSQWLWKESCVSTGVIKPGNTCASPTAMI